MSNCCDFSSHIHGGSTEQAAAAKIFLGSRTLSEWPQVKNTVSWRRLPQVKNTVIMEKIASSQQYIPMEKIVLERLSHNYHEKDSLNLLRRTMWSLLDKYPIYIFVQNVIHSIIPLPPHTHTNICVAPLS